MTVGERIKTIREAKTLSRAAFAKPLGVKGQYISLLESDKKSPSETLVNLLLSYYNVNQAWWDKGTGEIFKAPAEAEALDGIEVEFIKILRLYSKEKRKEMLEKFYSDFIKSL
jgi:transcriptional regulator with XRE-family HTH domain